MIDLALKEFHYAGPRSPEVLFVLCDDTTPTLVERLRGEAIVNVDAAVFQKRYLDHLGMPRESVGVMWCDTDNGDVVLEAIAKLQPAGVVFMGDMRGVGETRVNLPRFVRAGEVWKASYAEEAARKLRALRSKLDARVGSVAPSLRPLLKAARPHDGAGIENAKIVRLYKALAPERVVYGVVLDPYQIDLQGDWIPPKDIQDTAWGFIEKHGYISDRHESIVAEPDAHCVESSLEGYPSQDDYQKAILGLPHRAYRRKFGDDVVHSGAWIMAVKLSPSFWAQYLTGDLDAFSIEGFGTRTPIEVSDMPAVTFVDLEAIG